MKSHVIWIAASSEFPRELATNCRFCECYELAKMEITCGIDEAGRGPWAGPVVAGAVILDPANIPNGLGDSKALNPVARERAYDEIIAKARAYGVGIASVDEIDALNILQATFLAMRRAVDALGVTPHLALVDGNQAPSLLCSVRTIVKGDATVPAISAASILAKVVRDRMMCALDAEHPNFGWAKNKGYGTALHQSALLRFGITVHHRKSFKPISNMLCQVTRETQPIPR